MTYDIIFLGGGPGGYEGAIHAGKNGLKAAVIEMDGLGGTCLQRGCVPTKALLHNVKTVKMTQSASKAGLKFHPPEIDLPKLNKHKDRVVSKLTKGIELLFGNNGVDLIRGRGKIVASDTVLVDDTTEIKGKHIVLATGSVPAELPFLKPDGRVVINSDQALKLESIPEKMLVVGAGAIGLEMAVIYSYLGADVTVVEVMDYVVPGSDTELSDILAKELKKQKIKILTGTFVSDPKPTEDGNGLTLSFKSGEKEWEESYPSVLLAVGRKAFTENVFGDNLNITLNKRGFVTVNDNLETGEKGVFACGDVIGDPLLAHKASHQAIAIVEYIKNGKQIEHHPVPGAVYTFPEFASVGMTEAEAKEKLGTYKVGKFPFSAGSRSNAIDDKTGLVKVIADENETLIGAHIVGSEAGELMPLLIYGVMKKLKADHFKELINIHPTLNENVWEAIGEIGGFSIHI